jgi:hypothetical protein
MLPHLSLRGLQGLPVLLVLLLQGLQVPLVRLQVSLSVLSLSFLLAVKNAPVLFN